MAKRIPESITPEDFNELRKLLEGFRAKIGANQVSMRLNESGEEDHGFSYFVGFVQDEATRKKREDLGFPDPGLFRFGDDVPSKEYQQTIKRTVDCYATRQAPDPFIERDWSSIDVVAGRYPGAYKKKSLGSKNIDVHTGVHYRKYIGVLVDGIQVNGSKARRCVGMLGVGFLSKAAAQAVRDLDDQLKQWAQAPGTASALVSYLRATFELGGPIL